MQMREEMAFSLEWYTLQLIWANLYTGFIHCPLQWPCAHYACNVGAVFPSLVGKVYQKFPPSQDHCFAPRACKRPLHPSWYTTFPPPSYDHTLMGRFPPLGPVSGLDNPVHSLGQYVDSLLFVCHLTKLLIFTVICQ